LDADLLQRINIMRITAFPLLLTASLVAGCTSTSKDSMKGAAATPLNDLNLVNAPIPEVLKEAQKAPYALAVPTSCVELRDAVLALDEVLGPDLDTPATESNPGLIERGGEVVGGAVQSAARSVIPYRSWVRKLSGAERYSKKVSAAITAGTVRRAFLKGVARAQACDLAATQASST
jgi:hypothetical protein